MIHPALLAVIRGTLSEVRRILRDGGLLFLTVPARLEEGVEHEEIEPRTFVPASGDEAGVPHHLFFAEELEAECAGFRRLELALLGSVVLAFTGVKEAGPHEESPCCDHAPQEDPLTSKAGRSPSRRASPPRAPRGRGKKGGAASPDRIDLLLVDRGLAESRAAAQRLVMAGQVRVDGEVVLKPSRRVPPSASLTVDRGPRYVSRGGEKLEAALAAFGLPVEGRVCADVGASTGGFTDCLLQHGARRVYAIDVGHGLLHWRLRNDPRVVVMERSNVRHLEALPEPVDLVTIDVAFISLKLVLGPVANWLSAEGDMVALVKPQFEAGRSAVGRGGVVRDPEVHRAVLEEVLRHAQGVGLAPQGLIRSPLRGPKGNIEFLLWCRAGGEARPHAGLMRMVFP